MDRTGSNGAGRTRGDRIKWIGSAVMGAERSGVERNGWDRQE
jgi:hypothetical protein